MDIKIIVASHKKYWMPDDKIYYPVLPGAALRGNTARELYDAGYYGDDSGENISEKNPHYCELTVLYWAWKNLDAEYLGLAHYRRHFSNGNIFGNKKDRVITQKELEDRLKDTDILLPAPRHYLIETNYSQYAHAHHANDLDQTRKILCERYPQYTAAFDTVMQHAYGHRFNMFIMKREKSDCYCEWLFDILFELEKRLDISGYQGENQRVFGYVSERLLDVWVETNHFQYKDMPYIFMESQNWLLKGSKFLLRKFRKNNADE